MEDVPPKVNEALKDRVVAAAKLLGYQADEAFVLKACQLQVGAPVCVYIVLLFIYIYIYMCVSVCIYMCITHVMPVHSTPPRQRAYYPFHTPTPTPHTKHTTQELLDVRHSVMLLGPAGCGKTAIWRTLAAAHNLQLKVRIFVFFGGAV